MYRFLLIVSVFLTSNSATAMSPINDKAEFLSLISNKSLVLRLYTIRLDVKPNGMIEGSAVGRKVTGDWKWSDGYFCRTMYWGEREIPYNCQLVSYDGKKMRFTTDRGTGQSADFVLK